MKPEKIILHHSLTRDGAEVSWGAIRKYHVQTLGWKDIGYHAGVELIESGGERGHEILFGRSWFLPGAHTKGQNHNSLGLCFVGNYDVSIPDFGLLKKGALIIAHWMALFSIPSYLIYPHRAFAQKTCPGKLFNMEKLIEMAVHEFLEMKE